MLPTEHNLRHLRVLTSVVETGSVTKTASACNISQPAVTQALRKLEDQFGVQLFDRTNQGVFPNELAHLLAGRVKRALDILDTATATLAPRFRLTATTAKLRALVAVAESENFSIAARRLGIAQPTVHRAVTQLESEIGRELFRRTQYGSSLTRAGQLLANAAQLVFAELAQAEMELSEAIGRGQLSITLGGMPLSRSYILPAAIAKFHEQHPHVRIRVLEGPYDTLLAGLRRGAIDFLLGALRDPPPIDDITQEYLFEDELVIVSGPDHPLASAEHPNLTATLKDYPWILPLPETPARQHFEAFAARAGVPAPDCLLETSSMVLMREMLHAGPYLGCISRHQVQSELQNRLMKALPFALEESRRPIGITTRAQWKPTRTQAEFLALIRADFA
ncbi:transcriptional regulator [Nitratireductor aestuarii]|uniref:Transcriptional regulator n=1 Tax=Nitratireductor aestuarii TaxID=1735103 RepID=A0A916RVA3_9HYPH|nr:LysR family transcriptional regulator [Nitratireductor aestuarii]GGA71816.1 transcriptional regulator [Nitratireductor aestuarii]